MLIINARWLAPDGAFQAGKLRIKDGKIREAGGYLTPFAKEETFNAKGLIILPGVIDPHVHFREPGQLYKEGILNASKAALKGGVTTVLDMPNNKPPCSTAGRLRKKKELFGHKSLVNWGLHFHAGRRMIEEVTGEIKAVKIYMAKSSALPAITESEDLRRIFAAYPAVSIHAEDESAFDYAPDKTLHHERRPKRAVASALDKIERALKNMPAEHRPRVIICHMNTALEVDWLRRMKAEGFDIWGETAPHYLYFTQEDYLAKGALYQVNPPLRTEEDRLTLLQAISNGEIDFIGSDHAPHAMAEKMSDLPPSGIAGIEWLLPMMLNLIDEGRIDWRRLHQILTGNAADCYSILRRDGIKPGNYADLVFVKRYRKPDLEEDIITKVGVNLFEAWSLRWRVQAAMVNGIFKFRDGRFVSGEKGMEV